MTRTEFREALKNLGVTQREFAERSRPVVVDGVLYEMSSDAVRLNTLLRPPEEQHDLASAPASCVRRRFITSWAS
jgi:hypothetical protein